MTIWMGLLAPANYGPDSIWGTNGVEYFIIDGLVLIPSDVIPNPPFDMSLPPTIPGGASGGNFVPLAFGTEPLTFVSDGAGQPILVAYQP